MAVDVQSLLFPSSQLGPVTQPIRPSEEIAQQWLSLFEHVLNNDLKRLPETLHSECWWRDMLALSWDFRTIHGLDKVQSYLSQNLARSGLYGLRLRESGKFQAALQSPTDGIHWIESMFDFETEAGRGSGVFRLIQGDDQSWKGCLISTMLQELKRAAEMTGSNRPLGAENTHMDARPLSNWQDVRQKQLEFADSNPTVFIVGAGQSGLNLGARLQQLGLSTLIIDKAERIGDNWRKRYKGMYDEDGPPTEDADIYSQSLPIPVQFALNVGLTQRILEAEKDLQDGLAKAGFATDLGEDKSGIFRKYVTRGGGYYLDIGCSQLIIDGKIQVRQSPSGIASFRPEGLVLGDGGDLEADIVVLATGYDNMRTSVRKLIGDRIADRCRDVWDLNEEGEINAMWRSSGHPAFWFMGGNLALCRMYSKLLALQIKGIEEGLWKQ